MSTIVIELAEVSTIVIELAEVSTIVIELAEVSTIVIELAEVSTIVIELAEVSTIVIEFAEVSTIVIELAEVLMSQESLPPLESPCGTLRLYRPVHWDNIEIISRSCQETEVMMSYYLYNEPFYVHREFQEMIGECADDGS